MPGTRRLALASAVGAAAVGTALSSASVVSAAGPSPAPSADTSALGDQERELPRSGKPMTVVLDPTTGRVLSVSEGNSAAVRGKTVHLDPRTGEVLSVSGAGETP
ncbi:hypothetical protein [Microbispora sp. NPDC046933]|uniref:hypothetical protein n=1 Tax=Microbispora sp. NPDC046933 TaxID=3155618 RepID=UPI0033C18642